jgi:hypothetical protein
MGASNVPLRGSDCEALALMIYYALCAALLLFMFVEFQGRVSSLKMFLRCHQKTRATAYIGYCLGKNIFPLVMDVAPYFLKLFS